MAASMHLPPTSPSVAPVSYISPQHDTPLDEGVGRLGKTRAIRAIRSILGLFHKPGRRKSAEKLEESPMNIDLPGVQETKQFYPVSSCQSSTHGSYDEDMSAPENDKQNSDSGFNNCLDEFQSTNKVHNMKNHEDNALSMIGTFDDDVFQDGMKVNGNDSVMSSDDGDVFLNESYFEDDYFEDFSGGSSPANVECPLFTPPKKIRFRAKSFDCQGDIMDVLSFENISKGVRDGTIKRHMSMPCLSSLGLGSKEIAESDEPKNVDHLIHAPAPFFTLGMDMIADHFGNAEEPDVDGNVKAQQERKGDEETIKSTCPKDSSPHSNMSPLRCIKSNIDKEVLDHPKTPLKQRLSLVKDKCYTPITPFKKKPGENSEPAKTPLKSRRNLYKENKPSPIKIKDSGDNENKRITDGLSAVADWVTHVVAISGSNVNQDCLSDSEAKDCITKDITEAQMSRWCLDAEFKPSFQKCVYESEEKDMIPLEQFFKPFEFPPASKKVNEDLKETRFEHPYPHTFDPEHRPRLESGYYSRSRCSTPATPLSEPATPMSKLQSGRIMSPYSRNKLDGLTPRLNRVKLQSKETPKFLFPPNKTSPPLKTVEELTEIPGDSSRITEKSKSVEPDGGFSDVILSGGGDVDSLMMSSPNVESPGSSSGSVFWSASSMASRGQNLVNINIIDENNNVVQHSPFPRVPAIELPEISSPAIKKLQPISTSSPLQTFASGVCVMSPISLHEKGSHKNVQRKECNTELVPAQIQAERKDMIRNKAIVLNEKERKATLQVPPDKKRKYSSSRSARTARTCLRFGEDDSLGDAKVRRPSEDYIILKRVVKFFVSLGRPKFNVKPDMDIRALMGNLRENYHRIIRGSDTYNGIQLVSQLKLVVENTQNASELTIGNSVDQFLLNLLIQRRDTTLTCADFIFQNLLTVVRKNTVFMSLAPELVALLLSNDHCVVDGPNGFPLPYRASEKEVLKAAVKVVEKCNRENTQNSRRVQKLLYQVVDPKVVLKEVFSELVKSGKEQTTLRIPTTSPPRINHRISYHQTDCPTACDSRETLTSQSASCDVTSRDERSTLYELRKNGTINTEAPVNARAVCNENHFLRTLYFCYGSFEGVPYIADIGMQYVSKGKKKTLFLAAPPSFESHDLSSRRSQVQSSISEASAGSQGSESAVTMSPDMDVDGCRVQTPAYPVSERPSPFPMKKAAMVLAPGEHITAVSVLGNSDIHNMEIVTNTKRRVRAHGLPALHEAKWTRIRSPDAMGAPICLHALIGETRTTPTEGTRLCKMGALWAVTSWTHNDLNR